MEPSIKADFNGLKKIAKEFIDALPNASFEEADAGWKCFVLAYIGLLASDGLRSDDINQIRALYWVISERYIAYLDSIGMGSLADMID